MVVATYESVHEAELARGFLESNDVEAEVSGEALVNLSLLNSSAATDVKLWVDAEDALEAASLLEDYRAEVSRRRKQRRKKDKADDVAKRAFRASLIGVFICPLALHVYSLWLLLTQMTGKLSKSGRRYAVLAHVVNWSIVALFVWVMLR